MSLNSAQRRVYLKEKKSSDRALSIAATCQAATATIVDQSDSREERPVDVPHVAGIIKGNLCHPPIFPRPFALIPLPSLYDLPTIVSLNLPFHPSEHFLYL
jgi:hypothetical protein